MNIYYCGTATQALAFIEPAGEVFPVPQLVHAADPAAADSVPAAQVVHPLPAAEYVPAAQSVHAVAVLPVEVFPAAHAVHVLASLLYVLPTAQPILQFCFSSSQIVAVSVLQQLAPMQYPGSKSKLPRSNPC